MFKLLSPLDIFNVDPWSCFNVTFKFLIHINNSLVTDSCCLGNVRSPDVSFCFAHHHESLIVNLQSTIYELKLVFENTLQFSPTNNNKDVFVPLVSDTVFILLHIVNNFFTG